METIGAPDGNRNLWAAVIMRAIDDIKSAHKSKKHKRFAKDALWWINTPGSGFEGVCGAIGLRADIVRNRILKGVL